MENGPPKKKYAREDNFKNHFGPRFGREKPAIPGPGRPPLPKTEKERRAYLRAKIQEATPRAIDVLTESLNAEVERDRIRAAEILVTHSLPRQEEVELDATLNPFSRIEPTQLPELLKHIDVEVVSRPEDDHRSDRTGT